MSLKKAIATFTRPNGETITRQFSIKTVVFDYETASVEIVYVIFPSEEARERGAQPEFYSQKIPIDLTNQNDLTMILSVSAALWDKAVDVPVVTDFSELDENGKMKGINKSFNDLNAEIVDVDPLAALAKA